MQATQATTLSPEDKWTYQTTTSWFANTPTLVLQGPDKTLDGPKTALARFPLPGHWPEVPSGGYEFLTPKLQAQDPLVGNSPQTSDSTVSGGLISATPQEMFVPRMKRPPTPPKQLPTAPRKQLPTAPQQVSREELEKQLAELQAEVKTLKNKNKELEGALDEKEVLEEKEAAPGEKEVEAEVELDKEDLWAESKLHEAWDRVPIGHEDFAAQSVIHPISQALSFPVLPPPPPPAPPSHATCDWEQVQEGAQDGETPAVAEMPVISVGGIRLRPLMNPGWLLTANGQGQQTTEGQTARRRRRHRGRRGKRGAKNAGNGAAEEEEEEDEDSQDGA